jgi:hypothetical protein
MPFQKGQSGNPKGKPKGTITRQAALHSLRPEMKKIFKLIIARLEEAWTDGYYLDGECKGKMSFKERESLTAFVADCLYGKMSEAVEVGVGLDVSDTLSRVLSRVYAESNPTPDA